MTKEEYNKREEAVQGFVKQQGRVPPSCSCFRAKKMKEISVCNLKPVKNANISSSMETKTKEEFNDEIFLKSMEIAVTLIIDSFNSKNLENLENFCSKEMFNIFKQNIESSSKRKENYKTVIVRILDKQIVDKQLSSPSRANYVSIKLKTEQINYVEDENNNVTQGSKDIVKTVEEIWTFGLLDQKEFLWELTSIQENN
jgi:predicted lipid-binding transport protein (Tim44 family)